MTSRAGGSCESAASEAIRGAVLRSMYCDESPRSWASTPWQRGASFRSRPRGLRPPARLRRFRLRPRRCPPRLRRLDCRNPETHCRSPGMFDHSNDAEFSTSVPSSLSGSVSPLNRPRLAVSRRPRGHPQPQDNERPSRRRPPWRHRRPCQEAAPGDTVLETREHPQAGATWTGRRLAHPFQLPLTAHPDRNSCMRVNAW